MEDFSFYFGLGWEHIMSWDALDHILFIIALSAIYLLKDWKQVLILVTAFTIGHSLTLALSVTDVLRFPTRVVEILIPLTIVITAFLNFFHKNFTRKAVRINYVLALVFGLIHGMGFANTLRFMLASDQSLVTSLLGFNLGVEAGQVLVVILVLLLSFLLVQMLKLNRRVWVVASSAVVFLLAMKLTMERTGILEESKSQALRKPFSISYYTQNNNHRS